MLVETNGFELGDKVRDTITGVEGVITGIHQYITGCARVSIQPRAGSDNKVPDAIGADVTVIELVKAGPRHVVDRTNGGPRNDPHSRI